MADIVKFEKQTFSQRLGSMLRVDFRRMFTMPKFYIMTGIAFIMPVLILVMTTSLAGTETTNPETGEVTVMESFDNTWEIIASESGGASMSMDMTSMCNINLLYFMSGVLVCLFVSDDFKSGYCKNLFTVREKKSDYVVSKTIVCFIASAFFLIAFLVGTVIGGSVAGLSSDLGTAGVSGLVMCMLAKIFLMSVFVAIFLMMSVWAKHRTWLSILMALGGGMLLFMMIPMLTPLNSGFMNMFMCLAGGVIFAAGIGAVSNMILRKTSIL